MIISGWFVPFFWDGVIFSKISKDDNSVNVQEKWHNYLHATTCRAESNSSSFCFHPFAPKQTGCWTKRKYDCFGSIHSQSPKKAVQSAILSWNCQSFSSECYFIAIKPSSKHFFNENFRYFFSTRWLLQPYFMAGSKQWQQQKIVYFQHKSIFVRIDAAAAVVMASVAECDTLTSLQRQFKIENIFYLFFFCCFAHMSSINNASKVYYYYCYFQFKCTVSKQQFIWAIHLTLCAKVAKHFIPIKKCKWKWH